jgi:hypothetical protein
VELLANMIAWQVDVTGDMNLRLLVQNDGTINWGPGNAATDVMLSRNTTKSILVDNSTHNVQWLTWNNAYVETDHQWVGSL